MHIKSIPFATIKGGNHSAGCSINSLIMKTERPKVFIGSSRESLPVLKVVADLLSPVAEVIDWTEGGRYKQVAGILLDSLVGVTKEVDFAVLIFGHEDEITSRGVTSRVPRDNVIFELGLFMSEISRERTFVIVPENQGIKILSDLQGLNLCPYDPPADAGKDLRGKLAVPCAKIAKVIMDMGLFRVAKGPKAAGDIAEPLVKLIDNAQAFNKAVLIRNIGLDMELTWGLIRDRILPSRQHVVWQSLMIDGQDKEMVSYCSDSVSHENALIVEKKIKNYFLLHKAALRKRNIRFECRAYRQLPPLHGFMFNENVLFFSICGIVDKKLYGAPNPYIRLDLNSSKWPDETDKHFFTVFNNWFDYHWKSGRKIWPQ